MDMHLLLGKKSFALLWFCDIVSFLVQIFLRWKTCLITVWALRIRFVRDQTRNFRSSSNLTRQCHTFPACIGRVRWSFLPHTPTHTSVSLSLISELTPRLMSRVSWSGNDECGGYLAHSWLWLQNQVQKYAKLISETCELGQKFVFLSLRTFAPIVSLALRSLVSLSKLTGFWESLSGSATIPSVAKHSNFGQIFVRTRSGS
jgi:hypothetical protein